MTTIKDIARECGVSANTVSSVLNNKPGEVSADTSARVLEAMHRLGYRPNAAARRMVGKRMNTIGIADQYTDGPLSDPYKTQILEPIIHTARANRWDILYYSGHPNSEQAGAFPSFLDGRSDGLICFTGSIAGDEVHAILRTNLPVVLIGETQGDPTEVSPAIIDVDNELGAYLGVTHLVGLGHKKIAMIQGVGISGNLNRVAGYRRALSEGGIVDSDLLLYETGVWEQAAYDHAVTILSQSITMRPTAIFCFNDLIAFGVLRAARDMGIHCPNELSVVGFDDVFAAAATSPPLTTVRQPLAEIGQRAVHILIGIIEGILPRDEREIVTPELVVRGSTAPPPGY